MVFTLHNLRMRCSEVDHEYKVAEIREALEVLNRSAPSILPWRSLAVRPSFPDHLENPNSTGTYKIVTAEARIFPKSFS